MQHLSRPTRQWARAFLQQTNSSTVASGAEVTAVLCADAKCYLSNLFGGGRRSGIDGGRRGIHGSGFSLQAVGRGGAREDDDKDKDAEDEDVDEKPKGRKGKVTEVKDEDWQNEPMDYVFAGVPPDVKAACLSDASKEKMWKAYNDSPGPEMIDKLAETYRIRKQRVHAILWLKDLEKEAVKQGKTLAEDIEQSFEQIHGSYDKADNEHHSMLPSTKPDFSVQPEGWHGSVKAADQTMDEASAKEEKMMVEEFVQRMNFNKMQMAGIIKTDNTSRQRPAGGWSYLVEELGEEGKRGRRGGRRFIAQPDGSHRGLNDLEKVFLKRESVRPRRRLTPK
ncbi:unnamed protein product [Calypogeia fissa]